MPLRTVRLCLLRYPREDHLAERWGAGCVEQADVPSQHVIDQRAELVIFASIAQQRERVSKLFGQLRFTARDVRHRQESYLASVELCPKATGDLAQQLRVLWPLGHLLIEESGALAEVTLLAQRAAQLE